MDFRLRLLGITLAGGLAGAGTIVACGSDGALHVNYAPDAADGVDADYDAGNVDAACNANPDPCCADPDGAACLAKDAATDAPADAQDDGRDSESDAGADAPLD